MIAGALAFLAAFVVQAPEPAEPVAPIVLWHSYRGGEERALMTIVDRYRVAHPERRIEMLGVPNESLASKLTTAIPYGNGPDVFIFAHERIGGWARTGIIAPLVATAGDVDSVNMPFFPETTSPLVFEGRTWGQPLAFKSLALFYRTDLVKAPPTTTDALLAAKAGLAAGTYLLSYQAGEFYHHAPWFFGAGSTLIGADGKIDWDRPEFVASLAFLRQLVTEGALPSEPTGAITKTLFVDGKAAFIISGPWMLGELPAGLPFAVAPLPTFSPTGLPAKPFLTVEAVFVAGTSRQPDAARALADFIARDEDGAVVRATVGGQAVALKSAWDRTELKANAASWQALSAFRAQLPNTVPMDNRPAMEFVWEPGDVAVKAVLRGNLTPEEAAGAAAGRYRSIVAGAGEKPEAADAMPYLILLGALGLAFLVLLVRAWISRRMGVRTHDVLSPGSRWRLAGWVAPAIVTTFILVVVPFVVGCGLAFFSSHEGEWTFVGGRNFADILGARRFEVFEPLSFYYALLVTVLWTAVNIVLHVTIGFGLALVLSRPLLRLRPLYRVLLVVPWAVPTYITALVWKGMFHSQLGAINGILDALGLEKVSWFSEFGTSFFANVCANAWLGFPFMMVVSLGALSTVPQDLYQAAALDGASAWQRFRHITLPLVRPALVPAVLLGVVWTFNQFNVIYLVSGGEPSNQTEILISEAYRWAFARQSQYGYAAAYAVLIFVLLLGWSRYAARVSRRLEEAPV